MTERTDMAEVYDEWVKLLSPIEQAWCQRATTNIRMALRNVANVGTKELIVALLLFYDDHDALGMKKIRR